MGAGPRIDWTARRKREGGKKGGAEFGGSRNPPKPKTPGFPVLRGSAAPPEIGRKGQAVLNNPKKEGNESPTPSKPIFGGLRGG